MTVLGQLVFEALRHCCTGLVVPRCPPATSSKCSPHPNNLIGIRSQELSSWSSSSNLDCMKSIKVSWSWVHCLGGFTFPLSLQKLCSLHKYKTRAFMWWIGRCELSGDFRIHHQFVSTPKAHSMLN